MSLKPTLFEHCGVIVKIVTPDPRLRRLYDSFLSVYRYSGSRNPDIELFIDNLSSKTFGSDSRVISGDGFSAIAQKRDGSEIENSFIVWLDPQSKDGWANAFNFFYPNGLLRRHGFVLDGAAIVHNGAGYLVLGEDRKVRSSFLASVWDHPETLILTNDWVAARVSDVSGDVEITPAPYATNEKRMPSPKLNAVLRGVIDLRTGDRNSRSVLNAETGVDLILNSVRDFFGFERMAREEFELAARIARKITQLFRLEVPEAGSGLG